MDRGTDGIKERRWMDPAKDTVANMAAKAARMALQNARLTEQDIDFIVFATITPDYFFPDRVFYFNVNWVWMAALRRWMFAMPAPVSFMLSRWPTSLSKPECIRPFW